YIASSATIVDFIRSFAGGFIFTTSLPPAICSAAEKSITIIQQETELREKFFDQVRLLRSALEKQKVSFNFNHSHITIIPIGEARRCKFVASELLKLGVYLQPINQPT